jgi:hypothetical protein
LLPGLLGEERLPWETLAEFQIALEPDAGGLFPRNEA